MSEPADDGRKPKMTVLALQLVETSQRLKDQLVLTQRARGALRSGHGEATFGVAGITVGVPMDAIPEDIREQLLNLASVGSQALVTTLVEDARLTIMEMVNLCASVDTHAAASEPAQHGVQGPVGS